MLASGDADEVRQKMLSSEERGCAFSGLRLKIGQRESNTRLYIRKHATEHRVGR